MNAFLATYTWTGHGSGILGCISAESQKAAIDQVVDLAERFGHPRLKATIDTSRYQSITFVNGFKVQVSPMPELENSLEHELAMVLHGMELEPPT